MTTSVNLSFSIFDAATGGTEMWSEDHSSVFPVEGVVYISLGSTTSNQLDGAVFGGAPMFLEITVDGAVQSPRIPIESVPYAINAASAATLGTLSPSDVALSTHNHNASYAALNHNHSGVYAPDGHNHNTAYAALNHNHNGVYAPVSHSHSATDITSGTLNNARFDAYSNLSASGRLDNNATSDLLTRSQLDSRYSLTSHTHAGGGGLNNCTYAVNAATTNSTNRTATCPAGKYVVSGGCQSNSNDLEMTRVTGIPTNGASITTRTAWYCQWDVASTGYQAIALCCNI